MEKGLKIAFIQPDLVWEDTTANLARIEELAWKISHPIDLMVLPEMFNSGFSMNAAKIAEPENLHTTKWMQQMASQFNCAVAGSVAIKENGRNYNRGFVFSPTLEIQRYDKRHAFSLDNEHETYTPGTQKLIFTIGKWRIAFFICYDLRFPVWSRNTKEETYDLALYVAQWPETRIQAWDTLLRARAIENQAYVLGVNRTGKSPFNNYNGHSQLIDFLGNKLTQTNDLETVFETEIFLKPLYDFRQSYPFLNDGDEFELK